MLTTENTRVGSSVDADRIDVFTLVVTGRAGNVHEAMRLAEERFPAAQVSAVEQRRPSAGRLEAGRKRTAKADRDRHREQAECVPTIHSSL